MKLKQLVPLMSVWVVMVVYGMVFAMRYGSTPGAPASRTPALKASQERAWTCIMVVHPQCPCSRASISALRYVMEAQSDQIDCKVYFAGEKPSEQSPNMRIASAIKGAEVVWITQEEADEEFGSHTSGQAFIFDKDGSLAFSGGLTPGRGVDDPRFANDVINTILEHRPVMRDYAVFGCPLQDART